MKTILVSCLFFASTLAVAGTAADGKKVFAAHSCTTCHSVGKEGSAQTGPNLAGVTQRRDTAWLKKWMKNPDAMKNDPFIEKMDSKYHSVMPIVDSSDAEVDSLFAYLGSAENKSASR